jgi:butyrate kinase
MKSYHILTINPGSTSTKIGVFKNDDLLFELNVSHSPKQLEEFTEIWDQYTFRKNEIAAALKSKGFDMSTLDAVVGRGGLIKPVPSGTYYIDQEMIEHARVGLQGHHASNLGCVIAYSIGWENNIPSFIVDPPAVNDLEPLAKISGHKDFERNSIMHALNIFATARKYAKSIGKRYDELNLVVAHMGGGVTVAALRDGKAINVNNGLYEGPFTPERSGSLPLFPFMEKCLSGKYTPQELKKMVVGRGGLVSYFNTNNARDVEKMVAAGSEKYKLIFEAMAYQIAEEIGKRATNLKGKVDAVLLTGGLAHSKTLTGWIKERTEFISKVEILAGEQELTALAEGGLRVLRNEDRAKDYAGRIKKIGIIYWDNIEVYVSAINHIEDRLRRDGFVFRKENSNLQINYKNCKRDEESVAKAVDSFRTDGTELIFSVGSPVSVRLGQYLQNDDLPVIFTGIYSPTVISDFDIETNKNFYATCYSPGMQQQFENTVLAFEPELKKIGVLYRRGELQSEIQFDDVREYCKSKTIELISFEVQEAEDIAKAADHMRKQNVKWVYIATSTMIAGTAYDELLHITEKFHTVCLLEDTVIRGGLMGYVVPWKDVTKAAVDIAMGIFDKKKVINRFVKPDTTQLIINRDTAAKLGFEVPPNVGKFV